MHHKNVTFAVVAPSTSTNSARTSIQLPSGEKVRFKRISDVDAPSRGYQRRDKKMLKVVGASWFQTRLSSYIIIAMSIVGIVTIIFGELISSNCEEDGNYAATVFWRSKTGFRIEFWGQGNDLNEVPPGCARAYFRPDMSKNGWSVLEVQTAGTYPDWVQAYAAGLLEGSLTWQSIYWQWKNTLELACVNYEEQCNDIRTFLEENEDSLRSIAMQRGDTDEYWHQIKLFYVQIDGLERGWRYAVKRSRQDIDIPSYDFLFLNIVSDMNELERKFDLVRNNYTETLPGLSLSLVQLFNGTSGDRRVRIGQNTANNYNYMLRMVKRYEFNYHLTENSKSAFVPGITQIFSSYPGAISSQDDFYLIKSADEVTDMIVTGTPFNVFNRLLWDQINSESLIMVAVRVMAANRLARNGREWSELLAKGDVGTGNKQWLVLDLNRLNVKNNTDLLWVVEQIPGHTNASDQTQKLMERGYWASIGLPACKDIINITGNNNTELIDERKQIHERLEDALKVTSIEDLFLFMRNTSDARELNNVNFRGDLLHESIPFGVIDTKVLEGKPKHLTFQLVSGPPHRYYLGKNTSDAYVDGNDVPNSTFYIDAKLPPFQWSTSEFADEFLHIGHPDVWIFHHLQPLWVWDVVEET